MPLAPFALATSVSASICARGSVAAPRAQIARTQPPASTAPRNTWNPLAPNTSLSSLISNP